MELIPQNTVWKEKQKSVFTFFCPCCRISRVITLHPNPVQLKNFLRVGIAAVFFTLATWSFFGLKGMVSFIPLWIGFEFFYREKVRQMLFCKTCGFDPYLYKTNLKKTRETIQKHQESRKAKLTPTPPPTAPVAEETTVLDSN